MYDISISWGQYAQKLCTIFYDSNPSPGICVHRLTYVPGSPRSGSLLHSISLSLSLDEEISRVERSRRERSRDKRK